MDSLSPSQLLPYIIEVANGLQEYLNVTLNTTDYSFVRLTKHFDSALLCGELLLNICEHQQHYFFLSSIHVIIII